MKAQHISTPSRAKKIIVAVWVAAIVFSFLPAYFANGVKYGCHLWQTDEMDRIKSFDNMKAI